MKDKNGTKLIGVIGFAGLRRPEDNPQKVVTPWGTGFVWVVSHDKAEIYLDGGGIFWATNPECLEVVDG